MSAFPMDSESLLIDFDGATDLGRDVGKSYQSAKPYNWGKIDNFLPPAVLDRVLEDLKELPEAEDTFNRAQERLKTSYLPETLPTYTRNLFYALNSRPFLMFLENMTGIKGLIPDPDFVGGGIHVTANGGHLDIHADFNLQDRLNLERRLNVLIYLNKDWQEDYGGAFEIWEDDMSAQVAKFTPIFNRMVCFSTSSTSMHGNPTPVNHPEGHPRQSIALYYYTATWTPDRKAHTTKFKPRPGTQDQTDWRVRRREVARDWLPPVLFRKIQGPLRRIGF